MIRDFLKLWDFLTYYGLKSHVNFTEGLKIITEERIRVGKEGLGQAISIKPIVKAGQGSNKASPGVGAAED